MKFKLSGEDTGGALSIVEHPFEVGALVPPHLHTREDEYSFVLEGTLGFRSGDQEAVLATGGYITKPRGQVHAMWNGGDTPARMIEVISPAGFENFFHKLLAMMESGPPSPDELNSAGAHYGLEMRDPEWLPGLIKRYGLNPPPGA